MRYLIDEFKKAASFYERYTHTLRQITYISYEDAVEFSIRVSMLRLKVSFMQTDDEDDIKVNISFIDDSVCDDSGEWFISKLMMHESEEFIQFSYFDLNNIYATAMGVHLIKKPHEAHLLVELIEKTKDLIPNFINDINDKKLLRANYQPEKDMSNNTGVTLVKINALLDAASKEYTHHNKKLTNAVVTLENGFMLTGESFCADPNVFDALKGEEYALDNVRNKLWELENYRHAHNEFDKTVKSYQGGQ